MGWFDRFADWAADKVQSFTGEKERRRLVAELKDHVAEFKENVENALAILNRRIQGFNDRIRELNRLRQGDVFRNIAVLSVFLGKFGEVKDAGDYAGEREKPMQALPERPFETRETYISDVDWSSDEVFVNTFFRTPLGMKFKTRKQNLSMRERLHEFKLEAEHTLKELETRAFAVETDQNICALYIECIKYISRFIEEVILPELELVEAFFQALAIKDRVIAGHPLQHAAFRNRNPIWVLRDTPYEKHYLFVKNAFLFYVLSCKIYNTPVLTRLLDHQTTNEDLTAMERQKEAIRLQGEHVRRQLIMSGQVAL